MFRIIMLYYMYVYSLSVQFVISSALFNVTLLF